ncbi:FliH/SctL family protein [Clostridium sp.]|uniref:FliH/SctL family protein n=1 Tax=Clostridium sp. TaxID=1506 RepID=UPI00261F48B3|nr:flagellar assembly protein FliH [uncultured Clostridium sp.]
MQLYFNVIKNSRVIEQGDMEINTQLSEVPIAVTVGDQHNIQNANMESYEKIASNILENARNESEKITSKAFIDAAEAKTCAIKEGMEQGSKEGYENAYNDAISGAMDEAAKVKAKADSILIAAKSEYDEYLVEKEKHIKDLIVSIAESILKKEVKEPDAINEMIFNTLKEERNVKLYIIKTNSSHFPMIKSQIENWKSKIAFQGDIFVIEDNFLEDGTAVIEKETGKSIVSISYGIEKIKELFKEEQLQG